MIEFIVSKLVIVTVIGVMATALGWLRVRVQWTFAAWFCVVIVLLMPPLINIPIVPVPLAQNDAFDFDDTYRSDEPRWPSNERESQQFSNAGVGSVAEDLAGPSRSRSASASNLQLLWSIALWTALVAWILGAIFVWNWQRRALKPLGRLVRAAGKGPETLCQAYAVIAAQMRIRQAPDLVVVDGVFSPFLWHNWFGPSCIVLPETLVQQLDATSLAAILKHELCHFRRRDAARYLLEQLAIALWWWVPFSWMARRRLHELEEMCIDAEVVATGYSANRDYASALLTTEELLLPVALRETQAVPAFTKHEILRTRIEAIMNSNLNAADLKLSQNVAAALGWLIIPFGICSLGWASEEPTGAGAFTSIPLADAVSGVSDVAPKTAVQENDSRAKRHEAQSKGLAEEGLQKITLTRRTKPAYGKSAYSFRYRTQERNEHRNNVDLVYSTRGMLRINHHAGLDTGIFDMGYENSLNMDTERLLRVDWEPRELRPIEGHVYALAVKVQRHQMLALFRVTKVTERSVEFVWNPSNYPRWPIPVSSRTFNGESGMDAGGSGEGAGPSFKERRRTGRNGRGAAGGGGAGGAGGGAGGASGGSGGAGGGSGGAGGGSGDAGKRG